MAKKILLIDDSALMRRVISNIINSGGDYEVCDVAKDGVEGFDLIVSNPNSYDAVILDIMMPKMNGIELLKQLKKNKINLKVIVVSTVAKHGTKETIQALEYGAFDFVTKPEDYLETKSEEFKIKIKNILDVATSEKKVIKDVQLKVDNSCQPVKLSSDSFKGYKSGKSKLVVIACSTGGPRSLQQVIPFIPNNIDAGILVVQHMPQGFTFSLANRLNEMSSINVKEAENNEMIQKGHVYLAPGGRHIRIKREMSEYRICLSDEEPVDGLRPCANIMFDSLVQTMYDEIVCVVLTGMGCDASLGITNLSKNNKKIHVISQDEETSIVYGMPKAIVQTGLVDEILPLNQIAQSIIKNVGVF